jgi:hypothetical protein
VSPLKPFIDLLLPKNLTVMPAVGGIQVAIPDKNKAFDVDSKGSNKGMGRNTLELILQELSCKYLNPLFLVIDAR